MVVSVEDIINIDSLLLLQREILFEILQLLNYHRTTIQMIETNRFLSKGLSNNHGNHLYTTYLSNWP